MLQHVERGRLHGRLLLVRRRVEHRRYQPFFHKEAQRDRSALTCTCASACAPASASASASAAVRQGAQVVGHVGLCRHCLWRRRRRRRQRRQTWRTPRARDVQCVRCVRCVRQARLRTARQRVARAEELLRPL